MTRPLLALGVLVVMNLFALVTGFLAAGLIGVCFAVGFSVLSVSFGARVMALR